MCPLSGHSIELLPMQSGLKSSDVRSEPEAIILSAHKDREKHFHLEPLLSGTPFRFRVILFSLADICFPVGPQHLHKAWSEVQITSAA